MPKRSTGCFECRKRKVRCDEARPECQTCVRRGTKCPGYRPLQSFILHRFQDATERPAVIREDDNRYRYANHTTYASADGNGNASDSAEEPTSATSDSSNGLLRVPGQRASQQAPPLRQVSPIAIERVQHVGELIWLYLPRADPHTLPPPSALMLALPQLPATSSVLLAAVDALSAAQLAVANRNHALVNRSRSLYGTALTQMMRAIQYPDRVREDETLLATYLMTLYEVFVGVGSGHGFFYHVQGLLHILKQRGPSSFGSRLSMQIFHAIRYNSLSIGYHVRKASMLDAEEWMAVTTKAAKADPYVALIDICITIPRLLERTDKLLPGDTPAIDALIDDALALAAKGKAWFSEFEKNGPRYTLIDVDEFAGFPDICADRTFSEAFDFSAFGAGICYMIYWMSMLILQSNTFKLLMTHRQGQLAPKDLYAWDRKLASYADHSCRCVPYNCRTEVGYVGRFGTLTPLVVARKYFEAKKMQAEIGWCEKVYQNARIPGLYSTIQMEPLKSMQRLVQHSDRYI